MKAYKAFDKDMKCRGFQYEEGKSYEEPEAIICKKGFHACLAPIDVFKYYYPAKSVVHEVDIEDVVYSNNKEKDTKVCGKKIKIGARLSIPKLVDLQFKYVKEHCTSEVKDKKAASAGFHGAASAGDSGAASAGFHGAASAAASAGFHGAASAGDSGAASAGFHGAASAGDSGAACSKGNTKVGDYGVGIARGYKVRVSGGINAILTIAEENERNSEIKYWKTIVIDGDQYKSNTWYIFNDNGNLVEDGSALEEGE